MYITVLPEMLVRWLSSQEDLSDCVFCRAYPPGNRATPLTRPVVVIGSDDMRVLPNASDDGGNFVTQMRTADTSFRIGIHVPQSLGGAAACDVLSRVADALLFGTTLTINGISTLPVRYVRNTDSLYLCATLTVKETLTPAAQRETLIV